MLTNSPSTTQKENISIASNLALARIGTLTPGQRPLPFSLKVKPSPSHTIQVWRKRWRGPGRKTAVDFALFWAAAVGFSGCRGARRENISLQAARDTVYNLLK
jgi:hypothetical protein